MIVTDPQRALNSRHRFLDIFGMVWVTFLIVAALGAAKTIAIGPFIFSVVVLTYPVTYIFSDIFTEVYGYASTRRIVWTGFLCLLIASCLTSFYASIPPDPSYLEDESYRKIFLSSPVLGIAAVLCFFSGEFANSFTLARMKVMTRGKFMPVRLILSTLVGQTADNSVFYSVAHLLGGFYNAGDLPNIIVSSVIVCTIWEIIALPVTCRIIAFLKRAEGLDVYDRSTNFNPFAFKA